MAFGNLTITTAGQTMLAQALLGGAIAFTKAEVGDGTKSTGFDTTTALENKLYELSVSGVLRNGLKVTVTSDLANSGLTEGYYLREIAVYAKLDAGAEVLLAYDNAGEEAVYIPAGSSNVSMDGRIRFAFQISEDAEVTVETGGMLWAEYDHRHDNATAEADGFVSAEDKEKLDGRLGQAVNPGSTPTFAGMSLSGDLNMNGHVIHGATYES